MRSYLRRLLWLLITVLSLQGGAALAIEQAGQPVHAAMAMSGHAHHESAGRVGIEHCARSGAKTTSSHAKYPACASCCMGSAAPPSMPPLFHAAPLVSPPRAHPQASMTSFVPSALERPPRSLLA